MLLDLTTSYAKFFFFFKFSPCYFLIIFEIIYNCKYPSLFSHHCLYTALGHYSTDPDDFFLTVFSDSLIKNQRRVFGRDLFPWTRFHLRHKTWANKKKSYCRGKNEIPSEVIFMFVPSLMIFSVNKRKKVGKHVT